MTITPKEHLLNPILSTLVKKLGLEKLSVQVVTLTGNLQYTYIEITTQPEKRLASATTLFRDLVGTTTDETEVYVDPRIAIESNYIELKEKDNTVPRFKELVERMVEQPGFQSFKEAFRLSHGTKTNGEFQALTNRSLSITPYITEAEKALAFGLKVTTNDERIVARAREYGRGIAGLTVKPKAGWFEITSQGVGNHHMSQLLADIPQIAGSKTPALAGHSH